MGQTARNSAGLHVSLVVHGSIRECDVIYLVTPHALASCCGDEPPTFEGVGVVVSTGVLPFGMHY